MIAASLRRLSMVSARVYSPGMITKKDVKSLQTFFASLFLERSVLPLSFWVETCMPGRVIWVAASWGVWKVASVWKTVCVSRQKRTAVHVFTLRFVWVSAVWNSKHSWNCRTVKGKYKAICTPNSGFDGPYGASWRTPRKFFQLMGLIVLIDAHKNGERGLKEAYLWGLVGAPVYFSFGPCFEVSGITQNCPVRRIYFSLQVL